MVNRYGYGCYSCASRSCYSCSGCSRRADCSSGRDSNSIGTAFDRYEISEAWTTPTAGGATFPLTLTVHNFTIFIPDGTSTVSPDANGYITFVTDDGTTFATLGGYCATFGWIAAVCCFLFIACNRRQMFTSDERRPPRRFQANMDRVPNAAPIATVYSQPMTTAYAQPMTAYPYNQQSAYGQPMTAYPYGQQTMQYPQGQQSLPVARIVSPPTSPPEGPEESKDQ